MQAESIVDDTLKNVERFRVLCVGRAGVGKSSLINRVFRLEDLPNAARVEHYKLGHADINEEFTSPENGYFVLHDSKGFELGSTNTSGNVNKFIRERCDPSRPLKDQLHAVWLCAEPPRAGGRPLEKGDADLLGLAHDAGIPVVVVFTKYDYLVRTKRVELHDDNNSLSEDSLREQSKEEVRKVLDGCIQFLKATADTLSKTKGTPIQKPHHVIVSVSQGYEASISSLVQDTCELVSDKLKLMWAIAQRASRQVKINACVDIAMGYHKITREPSGSSVPSMSLRDWLGRVHQDIITCWNFRGGEKTLSSDGFKQLMLYLVQDIQVSQDQGLPHVTPPLAIDKISAFVGRITAQSPTTPTTDVIDPASPFARLLSRSVWGNDPAVQRLFMAYTTDLITVLKSLFDVENPSFSEGTMWLELNRVFQAYEQLDPREQIHRRICANFQHDEQINDPAGFRHELHDMLGHGPPLSVSERSETEGQNAQVTGAPPASSPSAGKRLPSRVNPAMSRGDSATSSVGPPTPPKSHTTSSKGHTTSPGGHEIPPGGPAPTTSPRGHATSPVSSATSSKGNTTSYQGHTTSAGGHETSPEDPVTSPGGPAPATSPRGHATSPVSSATSSKGNTTSYQGHTTSAGGHVTSPGGPAPATSPVGPATPPKGHAISSKDHMTSHGGHETSPRDPAMSPRGPAPATSPIGFETSSKLEGHTTPYQGPHTTSAGGHEMHETSPGAPATRWQSFRHWFCSHCCCWCYSTPSPS